MLVAELDVIPSDVMALYCKDNDAIALAKEPRSHQKSKHIEWQYMQLSRVKIYKRYKE